MSETWSSFSGVEPRYTIAQGNIMRSGKEGVWENTLVPLYR